MLGVRYYLAASPTAVEAAGRHPDLTEIAVSGPWHVYEVADAEVVVPLAFEPVVGTGIDGSQHGWLPIASAWFLDAGQHEVPIAATGPEGWERVSLDPVDDPLRRIVRWARDQLGRPGPIDQVPELPRTALPAVEVTDIELGQDTVRFEVSEPGVPVLVRTSYFPNWEVDGATGPYRVAPNLMVVVPTDTEVSMRFGRTPVDVVAMGMSLLGLIGLVLLARARPIEVAPQEPTRLAGWIDRALTLEPPPSPDPTGSSSADPPEPDAGAEADVADELTEADARVPGDAGRSHRQLADDTDTDTDIWTKD
jgi:hypothetical protein